MNPSPSATSSPSPSQTPDHRLEGNEDRSRPAVRRFFTHPGEDPFASRSWNLRHVVLRSAEGEVLFEQENVEAPESWSEQAVRMVASKYFRGGPREAERETSVRQLVTRVVDTIVRWGREDGYLPTEEDAETLRAELAHLILDQRASFNSPVWFNVGVEEAPQCSACFINSVEDTMESILDLAKTEGMLFKYGSGSGTNLSSLRGSTEGLSNGGTASGPVSFMRGLDAFAGAIKSGGRTRRAAKMVLLDDDHPDIFHFVEAKIEEEEKARALVDAGWDPSFDAENGAYQSVGFQNANHSVRLSDEFMEAVREEGKWSTRNVTDGEAAESFPAGDLLWAVAEAAWQCGDPGVQFSTTIDRWHTCSGTGPIRASNPCSEFLFLDDSACNLASLNLLRFWDPEEGFDIEGFVHACEILITAQEILVDRAGYPTPAIGETSRQFRPLGLGFANLGALLMAAGLPYHSDEGRSLAASVAALLTGSAYRQSARLARKMGAFGGFSDNREPMLGVIDRHRDALDRVEATERSGPVKEAAETAWKEARRLGGEHGFRNAQVSALAPTGTIAFMMDCDTTGVEPEMALVKRKRLVGGGTLDLVNKTVPLALRSLGYEEERVAEITAWIEEERMAAGAPNLEDRHLPVFDCALATRPGARIIAPEGHIAMLAALQPFISGAISKTVNVPRETSVEEIESLFLKAWKSGVKAVAIYRDGSKGSQPLSTEKEGTAAETGDEARRHRLPDERRSITHKFSVGQHEGYITVGLYEEGQPGEIFLVMAKEGSTISGLMDAFATAISIALQYGVPLEALVDKFSHTRFEPSGMTRNKEIPFAKSVTDYIFRWLASKFLDADQRRAAGLLVLDDQGEARGETLPEAAATTPTTATPHPPAGSNGNGSLYQQDAPACRVCGAIMMRNGTCYGCPECGNTSGCS
ncbi:MAG: vitamin B12-dependent ribonucleotide reductase [Thermoanaerobaculia bacterium]|nr:vitamin B12-dependent ribonucleotide reductase [Thermoanaerobaculia bacterium]